MTDWHNIAKQLLSGDIGMLIVVAGLLAVAIAISISKDPKSLGKHIMTYTIQLALIVGSIWIGYQVMN